VAQVPDGRDRRRDETVAEYDVLASGVEDDGSAVWMASTWSWWWS
jgi:hypothetical protein